jgi:copper homeostasis protein
MTMNFSLEICVDNLESAIEAQNAGANRIELCNNLSEGGTTPGFGTISSARNNLDIGLHVIIRPRGGDFLYTDLEYEIMRRDIDTCGACGVDGIVIGLLESNGNIDIDRTSRLIEIARPMSVTFHRAFDMCKDPIRGLEDVITAGADRILTSGQMNKAEDGLELIRQLILQAGNRIIIMPGSGINESNIVHIASTTGAKEFHLTGSKVIESEMTFRRQNISMGGTFNADEFSRKVVNPEIVSKIIKTLKDV